MSLIDPILETTTLKRWPMSRRPVAQPGTALVFQHANGTLSQPDSAITASEVSLRGHRLAYTVDKRRHGWTFEREFPSLRGAFRFKVSVTFAWQVENAMAVVQENVRNAPATCEQALARRIQPICRTIDVLDEVGAEATIMQRVPMPISLTSIGLVITGMHVTVSSDAGAQGVEREKWMQTKHFDLHEARVSFFDRMTRTGSAAARILAADPSKALEAERFLDEQLARDRQTAIDAMEVLLKSDQFRIGEFDDAVQAVVERFRSILAPSVAPASPAAIDSTVVSSDDDRTSQ
jgi:hypothetical protein